MAKLEITDDLDALLAVLPPPIAASLEAANRGEDLLEVILDLGRRPEARFVDGEIELSTQETTQAEIDYVASRIGDFGDDNRAGIARTLHRISAIRNRQG
ncbi:MAG: AAA family ATPase, partial [Anaerolineales bacterium]